MSKGIVQFPRTTHLIHSPDCTNWTRYSHGGLVNKRMSPLLPCCCVCTTLLIPQRCRGQFRILETPHQKTCGVHQADATPNRPNPSMSESKRRKHVVCDQRDNHSEPPNPWNKNNAQTRLSGLETISFSIEGRAAGVEARGVVNWAGTRTSCEIVDVPDTSEVGCSLWLTPHETWVCRVLGLLSERMSVVSSAHYYLLHGMKGKTGKTSRTLTLFEME